MAYNILQVAVQNGQIVFKEGDIVHITTTVSEITGRVDQIKQSGTNYVVRLDRSTQYKSEFVDISLASILSVETL